VAPVGGRCGTTLAVFRDFRIWFVWRLVGGLLPYAPRRTSAPARSKRSRAALDATGALRTEPTLLFIVVPKARRAQERPVMEQISDAYIFGLCAGLIAFLVVPLALVDGADDPATRFIAKWQRELAQERRAYFRSIGLPLPQLQSKLRLKARRPLMPAQTRKPLVKKVPAAAANKRRSTR
jgi:hypothetical protein